MIEKKRRAIMWWLVPWGIMLISLCLNFWAHRLEDKKTKKEMGDLLAQRDALVAACESVLESMDIATEVFGDSIANGMFKGAFLGVRKQIVAALALVKGGTSE